MNGLRVDPGSNGSVSVVAAACPTPARRLASARIDPSWGSRQRCRRRSPHAHRLVQCALTDVLKAAVKRQLDRIACLRGMIGRLGIPVCGPARHATRPCACVTSQHTVEGRLDAVGPDASGVTCPTTPRPRWASSTRSAPGSHRPPASPSRPRLVLAGTGRDDQPRHDIHRPADQRQGHPARTNARASAVRSRTSPGAMPSCTTSRVNARGALRVEIGPRGAPVGTGIRARRGLGGPHAPCQSCTYAARIARRKREERRMNDGDPARAQHEAFHRLQLREWKDHDLAVCGDVHVERARRPLQARSAGHFTNRRSSEVRSARSWSRCRISARISSARATP